MIASIAAMTVLLTAPANINQERIKLIPSGENIVFKMNTKGVIVTGTYDVNHDKGSYNPEKNSDIKRGDIILKINNKSVDSLNDLVGNIKNSEQLDLEISRNNQILNKTLKIYTINNVKKSGLYVKDRVLGVGTITYIDPKNMYYGALGHEVVDLDTKKKVDIIDGEIYSNPVVSVSKGSNQHPGEKISQTKLDCKVGSIGINSDKGMFGKYYQDVSKLKAYEIGYQNEVKKDTAYVLTCIKDNEVKPYEIKITETRNQDLSQTKSFTFKITDKTLLEKTGGVFSGMSGSPIIQNNRLIGSVTHVLVDSVEYGYGLYIENMYNQQSKLS